MALHPGYEHFWSVARKEGYLRVRAVTAASKQRPLLHGLRERALVEIIQFAADRYAVR